MGDGTREWVSIYLKGVLMGAADTVPGVSGGTIAFITGIYERLVDAVAALHPAPLQHLLHLHGGEGHGRFVAALRAMDIPFLAVLGAGVATAVILLSRVMHAALVQYPVPMNAFFFGLIGASAVVIYRHVSVNSPGRAVTAAGGFLAAFLVTGVSAGTGIAHSLPVVFVAGAVASAAMLLPGISGAAFLYILGQYTFLTGALTRTVDGILTGRLAVVDLGVVTVFLLGVLIGLLTIARLVRWSLSHYRGATLAGLTSLMVGALRMPVENVLAETGAWTGNVALAVLIPVVVGAGMVLGLDRYTDDLEY